MSVEKDGLTLFGALGVEDSEIAVDALVEGLLRDGRRTSEVHRK